MHYYNEFDHKTAAWLRELIKAKLIPEGDVDERSITDVQPNDVRGYLSRHYFAGIGGWPLALRLAGWPDTTPVDTGSCPCQPFSGAGKGKAEADKRHLWPDMRRILSECNSGVVFGEQVASKLGRIWLSGVRTDLEAMGFAVGAADLCAAGIGAPHIRQRLYWVADAAGSRCSGSEVGGSIDRAKESRRMQQLERGLPIGRLANPDGRQPSNGDLQRGREYGQQPEDSGLGRLDNTASQGAEQSGPPIQSGDWPDDGIPRQNGRLGDTVGARLEGHARNGDDGDQSGRIGEDAIRPTTASSRASAGGVGNAKSVNQLRVAVSGKHGEREQIGGSGNYGAWSDYIWLDCTDGKKRRTQPGIHPMAYGVSGRVGLLRGYGNAIVPWLAAEFIKAYMQSRQ